MQVFQVQEDYVCIPVSEFEHLHSEVRRLKALAEEQQKQLTSVTQLLQSALAQDPRQEA